MAPASIRREVARRVFAREFADSTLLFKEGDDQFARRYVLTPTGARCNRLFLVGTLTEVEPRGEGEAGNFRMRLVDPTGSLTLFAGSYQPEAARVLPTLEVPSYVALTAKVRSYERNGEERAALRPEAILASDIQSRNRWVVETARQTLERLGALAGSDVIGQRRPPAEGGVQLQAEDARRAREHYRTDPAQYRGMVREALEAIREAPAPGEIKIIDLLE
ncbi:MAG: DNA-binding protein [Euryarchaeota archaeon]|nr:DNA-binding protein [Euryarchaeota archaeon]